MFNKLRKKKGSSLLITVAMFAILSILIMSVLAMTTSGYSMRIKSNKRIENFYGADSGIEICQKLIYDYLTEAVIFGNEEVDKNKNDDWTAKQKNDFFRESFKKFIEVGGTFQDVKDEAGNNTIYLGQTRNGIVSYITTQSYYDALGRDKVKVEGTRSDVSGTVKEEYILKVKSTFDKDKKERIVTVDFYLEVPDYGKQLVKATSTGTPSIMNKIIGVDGDFTIETEGTTHVIGDMWVKGNKPTGEINKDNKYSGGIKILSPDTSNSNVKWLGNIVTNETLMVENAYLQVADNSKLPAGSNGKTTSKVKENIYARNFVYNFDTKNNIEADNSIGVNTDLYIYNDFVINGAKNTINIGNYYGLNDINNFKGNSNSNEAEKSSSIIINSKDYGKTDGSSLNIEKDAYVLGTSYIDLGEQSYQTGQSNVINQISKPYTFRFDNKNYIYDYKGILHLADKKENESGVESELELEDKISIIKDYYAKMENEAVEISKGTNINGNIYSAGAVMANGGLREPKAPSNPLVNELQAEYVKEVFNMGAEETYTEQDFWRGEPKTSVNDSFNWNSIYKIASEPNAYDGIDVIDSKFDTDKNYSFAHIVPKIKNDDGTWEKVNVDKIMGDAYKDKTHALAMYGHVAGGEIGVTIPNIILNGTDKKLKIVNKKEGTSGIDNSATIGDTIVYNLVEKDPLYVTPLLVISKGDILYDNFEGKKYAMLISAGEAKVQVSDNPGNLVFGNYHTAASGESINGHQEGERKFINELYKYIFESNDIMGEIGGNLFAGTEMKETNHAIDVSDLLKKKNWKLEK